MKTSDVCPYHFCSLIIVVAIVIITIIAHLHLHLHHHPHCSLFSQCADAERQQIRAFQTLSTHFKGAGGFFSWRERCIFPILEVGGGAALLLRSKKFYGKLQNIFTVSTFTYDTVAVNLKQLMVLDEISLKVIYPYFFASGQLILMHRTHFIQNIWRKWPFRKAVFSKCSNKDDLSAIALKLS